MKSDGQNTINLPISSQTRGKFDRVSLVQALNPLLSKKNLPTNTADQQQFIDKIVNLTPSLITVYNVVTGKYIFINNSIKSILGYLPKQWLDGGIELVSQKVHPDDLLRIAKENQKALEESNQTGKNKIIEFEYRVRHANGEYRWLRTYGTVFDRDEKNQVLHVINISLDVTAIKESEAKIIEFNNQLEQKIEQRSQELFENEKKFQTLLENSTDAIVLVSKWGKMMYASPGIERVLGYTPQEFLSMKKPDSLIHPLDRKNVFQLFTSHFKRPEDKILTHFRVLNKQQNYRWIEVTAANLLKEKSISAVVLNFRDVTDQLETAERQLEEIRNAALRLDINESLSKRKSLPTTLQLCTQSIVDHLEVSLTRIWLFNDSKKMLTLLASSGISIHSANKHQQIVLGNLKLGKIARDKKSYLTNDAINDEQMEDKVWIKKNKIKSFAGYPLMLDNKLVGVLAMFSKSEISPHTHQAFHSISDSIAQGIGRKFAEDALIESERKYHTIFATLAEGVILQDDKGVILAANKSAEKILDLKLNQMVDYSKGKEPRSKYITELELPFPETDFPYFKALKTAKPQINIKMGIVRENKTIWLLVNSIPLLNNDGVPYAVASSFQDITVQKNVELELEKSKERLELAQRSASIGTYEWDVISEKLFWTPELEEMFELKAGEFDGSSKTWMSYIHPHDKESVNTQIEKIIREGGSFSFEYRIVLPSGTTKWIFSKGEGTKDKQGEVQRIIGVGIDITNRKQLEKQKDEFISIASHELKTPLTTIKSFNEILMMPSQDPQKSAYYLNRMKGEISRLTELINDLLDVSKIQLGRLTLQKGMCDVDSFIQEVIEDIQYTTQTHTIKFVKKVGTKVLMDKYRMQQVLINLISNAIKYSPRSKTVTISAMIKDNHLIVSVKDSGIGISSRDQENIFDPFFQANTHIRQSYSGLGLGLHISSEIINRHGGSIWVKSKKGIGSTFSFAIPI